MANTITHSAIYGDDTSQITEFYARTFGWQVEPTPGVDDWRIFPQANGSGPLYGGVAYRAISGLNGWLLYVNVASLDETEKLVHELGGSVIRGKTAISKVDFPTCTESLLVFWNATGSSRTVSFCADTGCLNPSQIVSKGECCVGCKLGQSSNRNGSDGSTVELCSHGRVLQRREVSGIAHLRKCRGSGGFLQFC